MSKKLLIFFFLDRPISSRLSLHLLLQWNVLCLIMIMRNKKINGRSGPSANGYNPEKDIAAGANLPDPEHEISDAMQQDEPEKEGAAQQQQQANIPSGANLPDPEHAIEDAMRNDAPDDEDNSEWIPATRN